MQKITIKEKKWYLTYVISLSANPTKWSKTLKEFVGNSRRIVWVCLTILWDWRLRGYIGQMTTNFFGKHPQNAKMKSLYFVFYSRLVTTKIGFFSWNKYMGKSGRIRSFSGSYFPACRLNMVKYEPEKLGIRTLYVVLKIYNLDSFFRTTWKVKFPQSQSLSKSAM